MRKIIITGILSTTLTLPGTAAAWAAVPAVSSTRVLPVTVSTPITATGVPVSATEGALFAGPVATFTDTDPNATAADFTATVDWGDGTTPTGGSVAPNSSGGFTVTGTHTYAEEGRYRVTVTIHDMDGDSATARTTAKVADAPLSGTGVPVNAVERQPFTALVATFTDADPNGTASDYTAVIRWGDGSRSTGTVTANSSGGFNVTGHHRYREEGRFGITVVIRDKGGASTTVRTTADVADR